MSPNKPTTRSKFMNKRAFSIFISLFVLCLAAYPQSFSDIRRNSAYIYAEGTGTTTGSADSLALGGIVLKLAEAVDLPHPPEIRKGLMESYLDDLRRECGIISSAGQATFTVMRFIKRDDLGLIFARRREKVKEMISIAGTAEGQCRIDVALRHYSWAETLMRSLPAPDVTEIARIKGKREEILGNLNVAFDRQSIYSKDIVEISFTFRGKPVKSIDYRFYDGRSWSGVLSAKDGKGFVEVRNGSGIDSYRIKYEVTPSHLHHLSREVIGVEKALSASGGKESAAGGNRKPGPDSGQSQRAGTGSAVRKIDFSDVRKKVLEVVARDEFQTEPDSTRGGIRPVVMTSGYEETVNRICRSISDGNRDSLAGCFTEEGYRTFNRLIRYGNARVLNFDRLDFFSLDGEVYCRSVPMVFSFRGNKRQFVENVVFIFDTEGKICDLSFSLDKETVQNIISQDSWTEEARIILVSFLESYKTAYSLERLDYISSIFDDSALIITGRVLRNVKGPNEYSNNRFVTLTRQNKTSYIRNLQRVFSSQEYINLQFSDCEVTKLGKGEQLFGIKIRQEYFSTTYSDTGYLFILVDLRDYRQPVIHVRTWQEEPDKDFGVIGPYNF